MILEILILIVTTLLSYFFYTYKKLHYKFDKNGVKYLPGIPLFGNAYKSSTSKGHIIDDLTTVYDAFPGERYVGYIEGTIPIVMIRDPELIKTVTVKDFDHFVDHRVFFDADFDPLFGGSVFSMKGDRWRDMRTTLSPAFTGSKMKLMMPFMKAISNNIVEYLAGHLDENIDFQDLMRRYSNDVIASAGFGVEINSLTDKNNEFYKIGQDMFNFTTMQKISLFLSAEFPGLMKLLGIQLFPKGTSEFFKNMVNSTIDFRIKNNVERPDMIQLLIEASRGTLNHSSSEDANDSVGFATTEELLNSEGKTKNWTQAELMGQVFIFFVAGFESASSSITMAIHELAVNQDIQEKLYQELRKYKEEKGDLKYEHINELKYLDCVVNESLRKWSPALVMDRVCTKPYDLPPPHEGGKKYKLNVGDIIYNVVNCLHMDPEYFPNPEVFDPDRFSDQNKRNIQPFTYMPFGMGPRNCVGSRFALLEVKTILYYLVLNYKILKCDKTAEPIKLKGEGFIIRADGGTWAKLEKRK